VSFESWASELLSPSHSSEWISGIAGAGGALLGGLVTMAMTEWFNRRARGREEREARAKVTSATFARLNHIYSVTRQVWEHFAPAIESAKSAGVPIPAQVLPLQRMSTPVFFPVEEQWILTKIGGPELVNSTGALDYAFNLLLDSVERYGSERNEMMQAFPASSVMRGNVGTTFADQSQLNSIRPKIAACEMLLDQIVPMASRLMDDAYEAIICLVGAKSMPLGKKWKVQLIDPQGQTVTLTAGCQMRTRSAPPRQ